MKPILRPSRRSGAALAVLVAVTTLALVSNAVQTVTMPNISYLVYNLAPGLDSPDITIPVTDSPVHVMGTCTIVGRRGVAQATMMRTGVAPLFLEWVGLSSPAGPSIVGDWWPGGGSPHILWLDFGHQVELRAVSASAMDVRSLIPVGGPAATGTIKLIW